MTNIVTLGEVSTANATRGWGEAKRTPPRRGVL